jgi:serine/threonine protein kinase
MSFKRPRSQLTDTARWFDYDAKERIQLLQRQDGGNARIATGAFGEVSLAVDAAPLTNEWRLVVVKKITKTMTRMGGNPWNRGGDDETSRLDKEVFSEVVALRILSSSHPCIVPFLGLLPDESMPGCLCLAFGYSPMDLQMILDRQQKELLGKLPFDVIKTITKDVFKALQHCHAHGILHRDVKPGNFLVSEEGRIQLCDFGLAKPSSRLLNEGADNRLPSCIQDAAGSNGLCTLWYRPPEVLLGGPANHPAIDMYSAGLVVAELVEGRPIFSGKSLIHQINLLVQVLGTPSDQHWPEGRYLPDYQIISHQSHEPQKLELTIPRALESTGLLEFLIGLLALDPKKRMSCAVTLDHAWFTSPPAPMKHSTLAETLVPAALRSPEVILSSPETNATTLAYAKRQALALAATRRSFLKKPQQQERRKLRSLGEAFKSIAKVNEIM